MKRINFRWFFIFTLLLSIITYFSFNAAFSRDEGVMTNNIVLVFFANLYNIMRFPTHVILPFLTRSPIFFAIGLIVNCMLYALVLERVLWFIVVFIIYKRKIVE